MDGSTEESYLHSPCTRGQHTNPGAQREHQGVLQHTSSQTTPASATESGRIQLGS